MVALLIAAGLVGAAVGVALGWACGRVDGIDEGRAREQRRLARRVEAATSDAQPVRPYVQVAPGVVRPRLVEAGLRGIGAGSTAN